MIVENTFHGLPNYELQGVNYVHDDNIGTIADTAGTTLILTDGKAETITIGRYKVVDSVIQLITAAGSVTISLPACLGHTIQFRPLTVCDSDTGTTKTVLVLCSEPY